MRVFQVAGGWSMENLAVGERPVPNPGPRQVRLTMRASAVNYRDLLVPARGYGSRQQTLPLIMLGDGVGVVESVGEGVTRLARGDRVCPIILPNWLDGEPSAEKLAGSLGCELDGTMTEYMVVDEQAAVCVPSHLTDAEAAALPIAGVTAWRAVVTEGRTKAGDRVLLQGTGGVSLFALQFAKLQGAHVTVISSSDHKLERAMAMGADHGINYRTCPEWGKEALATTGGTGFDFVLELGGKDTVGHSLRAIRPGGTIALIGVLSGDSLTVRAGPVVTRHVRLQGVTVGSRRDFESMVRAVAQHRLRPAVDRIFKFEELREALACIAAGGHFGKIAISH
jgi:NADPH:quinone reductase-like Zn-dependent oxidoreductase